MQIKLKLFLIVLICGVGLKLRATTNPQVITALPALLITNASDVTALGNDSATVDAIMPYLVNTDPFFKQQPTLFNPSIFNWTWSHGAISIEKLGGGAIPVNNTDTIVQITMPSASTIDSVGVSEKYVFKFDVSGGCTGNIEYKKVVIVNKPTLALNLTQKDTIQSCSVATNNKIKIDFSGNGVYYVEYEIKAYNLAKVQVGITKTYYAKLFTGHDLSIYADQLAEAAGVIATIPAPVGEYRVIITGLWDGISVRAINKNAIAVVNPLTDLSIFVFPAPVKPTIKFIKTL